jgi:hypothetical protein
MTSKMIPAAMPIKYPTMTAVIGGFLLVSVLTGCANWKLNEGEANTLIPVVVTKPVPHPPPECLAIHGGFPTIVKGEGQDVVTPAQILELWRVARRKYQTLKGDHEVCKVFAKKVGEMAKQKGKTEVPKPSQPSS